MNIHPQVVHGIYQKALEKDLASAERIRVDAETDVSVTTNGKRKKSQSAGSDIPNNLKKLCHL